MTTILIADDEERIRNLVHDYLSNSGYKTLIAKDGKEALALFNENNDVSLCILDVMMPEYDGWSVCREIRKTSAVPIIMLTARGEENDELFGFELGADEYIKKPFSPKILVARVNALLKREKSINDDKTSSLAGIELGGIEINEEAHIIKIGGTVIDLSPQEYKMLLFLIENSGRVLNRDQIINGCWDYNYCGDGRTVDTHIKKLRLKLLDKGKYIQTVRGFGYKFSVH